MRERRPGREGIEEADGRVCALYRLHGWLNSWHVPYQVGRPTTTGSYVEDYYARHPLVVSMKRNIRKMRS